MRFGRILIGEGEIGCVLGVSVCGNMKPSRFCMYPCRGVLHMPPKKPRRRFRYKIGRVLGVILIEEGKIGCVFGVSLLGRVK